MGLLPPPADPVPITVFPQGDFPQGVFVSSSVPIPLLNNSIKTALTRNAWPDTGADVVEVRIDLTLDGGITYSPDPDGRKVWPWGTFPIKFTARGGASVGTESSSTDVLPDASNPNRATRITLNVKSPINTALSVTPSTASVAAVVVAS